MQRPQGDWAINWSENPGYDVYMRNLLQRTQGGLIDDLATHTLSRYASDGDTSIGLCNIQGGISGLNPARAFSIAKAARISGSPQLVQSAQLALERMSQFSRPDCAQIWEAPINTPDLLASAYAIRTFLEGYRMTRQTRWLDLAERYAWYGLAFVYVWETPDRPMMKYSTIAYYGGAHGKYTLCGTPVTWNGLEFAKALIHLSKFRTDFPWDHIAEGIVLWVLRLHPPGTRQWPDWVDLMTGNVISAGGSYQDDRPGRLLAMLEGLVIEPETEIRNAVGTRIRVTVEGEIQNMLLQPNTIITTLQPKTSGNIDVAVGGVGQVQNVRIIQPVQQNITSDEYHSEHTLLLIHLGQFNQPVNLQISTPLTPLQDAPYWGTY